MQKLWVLAIAILLMSIALPLGGCALRAPFNQYSFDETAGLKKQSTALIGKSNQSFGLHYRKAATLRASVFKAYQDSRLRALNEESMRVWLVLLDAKQSSLAGALNQWELHDTLTENEREDYLNTIEQHFDDISKLESEKKR